MDLGEKVKNRREELGLSQEELAKKMNYKSKTSIHKIEQGVTDLPLSKVEELAKVLKVSVSYLMGWSEEKRETPKGNGCIIDGDFIKMIPLFGSVSAGFGSLHDEYIEMIPIVLKGNPDSYVAITVNGDSMEDRIMDKSIVVVNKNCPIYNGDIGIFRVNEEVFVKQKIIKNKKTYLHSFNEYYKDIEIKENDDYVELGKVTEVITRLK